MNEKKIDNFVGKKVLRTFANKRGDTSFTQIPIMITRVTDTHIFHTGIAGYQEHILCREEWDDMKWVEYEEKKTEKEKTMEKTGIDEYPLNLIEAFNKAKEGYEIQGKGFLVPFFYKKGKVLHITQDGFRVEVKLNDYINDKFKVLPKKITWYEADKVHLVDDNVVVEFEVMGKSKEAVIKYIDEFMIGDFEVLNWKEKELPENPEDWHND